MRPANIVTAFADILAGFAAVGGAIAVSGWSLSADPAGLGWLLLSTFGLYGGGVVLNDVFDVDLDATERPERAIPSGRVSRKGALLTGVVLLLFGIVTAFQVNSLAGILALSISTTALLYDYWAKHSAVWGPLFMGLCRGGNLLLGAAVYPLLLPGLWYLALFPVLYIGAITLVSQGEVHGGSRKTGFGALGLVVLIIAGLFLLSLLSSYAVWKGVLFVILFAAMVVPPFWRAAMNPKPSFIKEAVKRGVLALIVLNAALAAGFGGITMGLLVLILLPLSILLSNLFAVT